jgi:hypothetical protein
MSLSGLRESPKLRKSPELFKLRESLKSPKLRKSSKLFKISESPELRESLKSPELRESPKSSENEKLLSCGALLQNSELIKKFKQLNDSKLELMYLKESTNLYHLSKRFNPYNVKGLNNLDKLEKNLKFKHYKELEEDIEQKKRNI